MDGVACRVQPTKSLLAVGGERGIERGRMRESETVCPYTGKVISTAKVDKNEP